MIEFSLKNQIRAVIMIKHLLVPMVFVVIFSCAPNYQVVYETYVSQSPMKSLTYKDEKFHFKFLPVENGVFFSIRNLTPTPAVLLWDRSYFIEPNNNSSKLLNTDIMYEEEETTRKAKYASILPPGADFLRFTTSALNVHKFTDIKSKGMSHYMQIFGVDLLSTHKNIEYQTFLSYGRYWPSIGKVTKSKLYDNLRRIKEYVENNNNMGIGFAIQLNEDIYDYRFDFKFKKVSAYREIQKHDNSGHLIRNMNRLELKASMEEENSWTWDVDSYK